jgi:hypothetical protein
VHLGYIAPRLQTCSACYCTEYCRQFNKILCYNHSTIWYHRHICGLSLTKSHYAAQDSTWTGFPNSSSLPHFQFSWDLCMWHTFYHNIITKLHNKYEVTNNINIWWKIAFPPFLVKQLYRCDSVIISSFVRTGYTMTRWGWLLGRIGFSFVHHYTLYM